MLNDTALITMAARLTGWKTVRCTSFGQPRNWHQMVTMIPVSPVSPTKQPVKDSDADVGPELPNCTGLNAGRAS